MEESALQFVELIDKNKKAFLAPMAGITDRAFREIAKEFGAGYVVSEMVSSKAISYNDKKSVELMKMKNRAAYKYLEVIRVLCARLLNFH